jgi:hypothetical protein
MAANKAQKFTVGSPPRSFPGGSEQGVMNQT